MLDALYSSIQAFTELANLLSQYSANMQLETDAGFRKNVKRQAFLVASSVGRFYSRALSAISNADASALPEFLKTITDLIKSVAGGGSNESPSLKEFTDNLSFMADISGTNGPCEPIIAQRLLDCAMAVADYCGIEYNPYQPPGMFIYRVSIAQDDATATALVDMAIEALSDCLDIADSAENR